MIKRGMTFLLVLASYSVFSGCSGSVVCRYETLEERITPLLEEYLREKE